MCSLETLRNCITNRQTKLDSRRNQFVFNKKEIFLAAKTLNYKKTQLNKSVPSIITILSLVTKTFVSDTMTFMSVLNEIMAMSHRLHLDSKYQRLQH